MRSAYSSAMVPAKVRRNASLRAIEEPRVKLLLQLPDLKCHGRLRHEQRLCRLGERQVFRHGLENLESSIRQGATAHQVAALHAAPR